MTDLQLATLLRQYARRLFALVEEGQRLDDQRDLERHWIGEGEPATPPVFMLPIGKAWENHPYNLASNWEMRPTGRLSCLALFEQFAEQIENDAIALYELSPHSDEGTQPT